MVKLCTSYITVGEAIVTMTQIKVRKLSSVEFMGRSSTAAERPTTVNISSWGTPEEGIYIDTLYNDLQ
jgi:hypothetical protein